MKSKLPARIYLHKTLGQPFAEWFAGQRKRDLKKASPLNSWAAEIFLWAIFPERFPYFSHNAMSDPQEIGKAVKYAWAYLRHIARSKRGRAKLALLLYCYHNPAPQETQPTMPAGGDLLKKKTGWTPHKDLTIRLYHDGNFIRAATPCDDFFEVNLEGVDIAAISKWASHPYLKNRYGLTKLHEFGVEDFRNAVKALRTNASELFSTGVRLPLSAFYPEKRVR